MNDHYDEQDSRRAYHRAPVDMAVTIVTADGQEQYGQAVNISQGGMFIQTIPVAVGEQVSLAFYLPDLENAVQTVAIVRWNEEQGAQGIGVQFEPLRAMEVWAINKIFERRRQAEKDASSF
jgi:Tfp pilus assembly protein PilZ